MAIEVQVKREKEVRREYPYLGRHGSGMVVLFLDNNSGILLIGGHIHHSNNWLEDKFTPLSPSESITLSNKV